MRAPPLPADETVRLDTLSRCQILDTQPEPSFDGLVDLAAAICIAPIALVTFIDSTRQWFKSKIGWSVPETPRDIAFCAHAILGREVFIVEDANIDVRFADNPLVTGDPHIRFYAGAPIVLSDGTALGTIAVIDTVSRRLSVKQTSLLTKLAGQAAALLESRKEVKSFERELCVTRPHLHYIDLGFRVGMWEWEPSTGRLAWTPHLEELYGVAIGSVRHYEDWRRLVYPEDLARVEMERDEAVRNHQPFDLEFRIVKLNGDIRWVASRGSASYDESGNPALVMGNTHDITTLKEMGAALWASRWQLQTIVEGTSDAMFIKDLQGRYLLFNGAAGRLVGKNPDHMVGQDDTAIFPLSQAERMMAQDQVLMAGGKVFTFEDGPLDTANGKNRFFLSTKGPFCDDEGTVIGLFGIARDITERKLAEASLRESEERFRNIFEHAGNGIAITDLDGRFLRCNPAYCELLGYTEAELCELNFKQVVHPADLATNLVEVDRLRAQEVSSFEIENRSRHKDGHDVWVHKFVSLLRDDSGQPASMFTLVTDVTARRRMREMLEQCVAERTAEVREREAMLTRLITHFPGVVSRIGRDLTYQFASPQYEEWFGKKPDEIIGCSVADVIGQATFERAKPAIERVLAGKSITFENVWSTPTGKERHGLVTFEPEWDQNGVCVGFMVFAVEITARKRMEEALRESQERYALAVAGTADGIWDWDSATGDNYLSPRWKELLGYQDHELPNREESFFERLHPDDLDRVHAAVRAHLEDREPYAIELRLRRKDGSYAWFLSRGQAQWDKDGTPTRMVGAITDITERKLAEVMQRRLATIIESSDGAIIGSDLDGRITSWNRSAQKLLGYAEHEVLGFSVRAIIPDDRQVEEDEILARLQRDERVEYFETVRRHKDGTLIDVAILISPIKDQNGVVVGASKIMRDNRERKLMEQALRESEERLRLAQAAGKIGTFDWDIVGGKVTWSPQLEHIWGLPTGGFGGTNADWARQVHPEDIAAAERLTQRALMDPSHPYEYDHRIVRPDGSERWISAQATIIRDETGHPLRMVGINMDITDRKQAEEKFRNLLEAAPDALVIVDSDGRMMLVNQQTEQLFGYSRLELLDQPIDMLLPERFRAQHVGHRAGFVADPRVRPMGSGLDLWARHRDGHEFPVEISLSPLETESGRLVTAAIRDITDRKAAYTALQQAHQRLQTLSREVGLAEERVRGALSRELHDEFGQLLSALKYDTKTLGSSLARQRVLTETTKKRVAAIIQTVDRLFDSLHTMVRGLRPAVLEKLGLIPALESFVEDTQARFCLVCHLVTNSIAEPTPFGMELDATAYRMTQELVTNVIRHAKASSVTIRLEANGDTVQLTVEDDGVGFAAAAAAADRYGLRGIRERAELLGGTVAIRSQPGEGTTVTVEIPLRDRDHKESCVDTSRSSTPGPSPQETLP